MGAGGDASLDAKRYLTNDRDFAISITFSTPASVSPTITKTINGLATHHHFGYDETGKPISSKTVRVSFSEAALSATGYPVRDGNNKVSMFRHLVSFETSAGYTYYGEIRETMPDEMTGMIVCRLSDKT